MVKKKKDSCAGKGSAVGQLNKSKVLFHVVFLAAPLHTLYIAFFLPTMEFFFISVALGKKNILAFGLRIFLLELQLLPLIPAEIGGI